jgi:hypothetical protein
MRESRRIAKPLLQVVPELAALVTRQEELMGVRVCVRRRHDAIAPACIGG